MTERCGYCGNTGPNVSMHSGTLECSRCWDWRKLTAPAASYWAKRLNSLFEQGPDSWDWTIFERRFGLGPEVERAFMTMFAVKQAFEEMLDNPRPWKETKP